MSGTKGVIYSCTFQWLCLLAIPAVLLFTACTNNDDDSLPTVSGQETVSYAVTGFVVKGGVAGSTVNVHALGADGVRGAVLATASTDGSGAFNLVDAIPAPAEVVAMGGSYKDEATGQTVDMTGRELTVILLNGAAAGSTVAVTPLTKIAASQTRFLMESLGADLTTAVNRANEDVTDQFGITGVDITSVPPLDMSASSGGATALTGDIDLNSDAARYGLVILGLSQTAVDENRPPGDVLKLIDNIATDMANSILDEGDQLPYNDFPRSPGNTLCQLGIAIDDFLGGSQNTSSVTPADVDHKTYPNGVDCGGIAAAPAPGFQCTDTHVINLTPGDGQINVEWRATDGADWYDLYYAAGANPTVTSPSILNIGGGAITQLVTGLTNGQEYCFGVIANGCSFGQILCDTPNGPAGYSLWWESALLNHTPARAEVSRTEPVSGCNVTFTDGGVGDPDGTRNGRIDVCLETNAPPVMYDEGEGCLDCHMGMIDMNNSAFASADVHLFPIYSDMSFFPEARCNTMTVEDAGTHTAIFWLYVGACEDDGIIYDYCDANPANCVDGNPLVPLTDLCGGGVTNECTATFVFPSDTCYGDCMATAESMCAGDDYYQECLEDIYQDCVVGRDEFAGCGPSACEASYCNQIASEECSFESILNFDCYTTEMQGCTDAIPADVTENCGQTLTLWGEGAQTIPCGSTVTDGGQYDGDELVNGCVDINMAWNNLNGESSYSLWASFQDVGYTASGGLGSDVTSRAPFWLCAQDVISSPSRTACDGLPCTFTDTYHVIGYLYGWGIESNTCPITFDFPGEQSCQAECMDGAMAQCAGDMECATDAFTECVTSGCGEIACEVDVCLNETCEPQCEADSECLASCLVSCTEDSDIGQIVDPLELTLQIMGMAGNLSCEAPITIVDNDQIDIGDTIDNWIQFRTTWNDLSDEFGYVVDVDDQSATFVTADRDFPRVADTTFVIFSYGAFPGWTRTDTFRVRACTPRGEIVSNTCTVNLIMP